MDDFARNLAYLFGKSKFATHGAFGEAVNITPTTLSRLFSGARQPSPKHKEKIAARFNLDPDDLTRDYASFVDILHHRFLESDLVLISLRAIEKNKGEWAATARRFSGQYVLYYGSTESQTTIASLLTVEDSAKEGVPFTLINPYKESSGATVAYEYKGFLFPIRDYLYFFAEQIENDYEVLTLIMHDTRAPRASLLRGIICGIGVKEEMSAIASQPIFVIRQTQPIQDWRQEVGKRLGFLQLGQVPEMVRRSLTSDKIIVPA